MSKSSQIVSLARSYVQTYLLEYLPPTILFHNFDYAEEVSAVCKGYAADAKLSSTETENLEVAAWFLPTGYVGGHKKTAQRSAEIVAGFLEESQLPQERIQAVSQLILSSSPDYMPQTITEKVFFDARWSYLGRKRFSKRIKLLRLEKEQLEAKKYSPHKWNKFLLNLLINTPYYTTWGKSKYTSQKNLNLAKLRQELADSKEKDLRTKTGKNFGRGVDTVYRITLRNHINLSSIADGKANMIININTPILSAFIAVGTAGISMESDWFSNKLMLIPIIILMLSTLLAIFFAVLSVIPKISGTHKANTDPNPSRQNMLYFGNFLNLEKEEFVEHLRELKKDQSRLYDELSRDLYSLGLVLQKKYGLLTTAYRFFIGGLVLSVLAFLVIYIGLS